MDRAELKELLKEILSEGLEEKINEIVAKNDHKKEKKQKFRRRNQHTEEVKKTRKGKRHVKQSDPIDLSRMQLTAQEKKELEQASRSDKLNNVDQPRERMFQRRPSGKVEVRCRSCGKTEMVSPVLLYRDDDGYRYKCNKCSCSPG